MRSGVRSERCRSSPYSVLRSAHATKQRERGAGVVGLGGSGGGWIYQQQLKTAPEDVKKGAKMIISELNLKEAWFGWCEKGSKNVPFCAKPEGILLQRV